MFLKQVQPIMGLKALVITEKSIVSVLNNSLFVFEVSSSVMGGSDHVILFAHPILYGPLLCTDPELLCNK